MSQREQLCSTCIHLARTAVALTQIQTNRWQTQLLYHSVSQANGTIVADG